MTTLLNPYFGEFGGMYVPQILMPALRQLEDAFVSAQKDPEFQAQFTDLLKNYAGRPTALTKCQNITAGTNTTLYLKREDLLHGGAHKTNQVLGQALLAKRMGKTEIIAETGAGQHGVASALASALLGLKCRIYMGAKDVERQSPNVFRMRLMGAEVIPVHSGSATLKDACNEALRDWSGSYDTAHYMLGTGGAGLRAIRQLAGQAQLAGRGLAADFLLLLAPKPLVGSLHNPFDEPSSVLRRGGEPNVEGIAQRRFHDALRLGRREAVLGLADEFGFANEDREHGGGRDHHVLGGDRCRTLVARQFGKGL